FRTGYRLLCDDVRVAALTQVGDPQRLDSKRQEVLAFIAAAEQHVHLFPPSEYQTLTASISAMLDCLEQARLASQDPIPTPTLSVSHTEYNGRRGRPSIQIDRDFLEAALTLRGPAGVASVVKCSARTIRRRALDLGLVEPGPPVYRDVD
ncbi:hypothetical protein NEOLEDRAFT_1018521, partial [Neolentinus lepideus HHB14362 ss-1]